MNFYRNKIVLGKYFLLFKRRVLMVMHIYEGLDGGWGGGSGIHYSLKFSPLFILLKFWVIH